MHFFALGKFRRKTLKKHLKRLVWGGVMILFYLGLRRVFGIDQSVMGFSILIWLCAAYGMGAFFD